MEIATAYMSASPSTAPRLRTEEEKAFRDIGRRFKSTDEDKQSQKSSLQLSNDSQADGQSSYSQFSSGTSSFQFSSSATAKEHLAELRHGSRLADGSAGVSHADGGAGVALRPRMVNASTQTEPQVRDGGSQTDATGARPPRLQNPASPAPPRRPTSEAGSDTSASSYEGGDRKTAQISSARITPRRKRVGHIRKVIEHWNLECSPHFCCTWHQAVLALVGVVDKLRHEKCSPEWSPHSGSQCPGCFSMHEAVPEPSTRMLCSLCGHIWEAPGPPKACSSSSPGASSLRGSTVPSSSSSVRRRTSQEVSFLPRFPATPMRACISSYLETVRHWNIPRSPDFRPCCTFHSHALVADILSERMRKEPCDNSHTLCSAWSCGACRALNDEDMEICEVCGSDPDRSSMTRL